MGCYAWLQTLDYIRFAEDVSEVPALAKALRTVTPHYNRADVKAAMQPLSNAIQGSIH